MINTRDLSGASPQRRIDAAKTAGIQPNGPATVTPSAPASEATRGAETLMSRGLEAARRAPDIDPGRIETLKAAIASGSFRVDAQAVASAMLAMQQAGG